MKKQNIQAEIDFFNKIAENNGSYDTISEDVYNNIFIKINPHIKNRVLEAGCGTGAFGLRIKKHHPNIHIIGVDLNQKLVNIAKGTEIYEKLLCANLEDQGIFKQSEFDTIICPYLLHHLPDMQQVVDNFYYWLKPNGYVVIIDPNGSNLIMKISQLLRVILSKFIDIGDYASINEAHKSVCEFKRCLAKYKMCSIETFQHKSRVPFKLFPFSYVNVFAIIQKTLLKFYEFLPFVKYPGSDLIIISEKYEKI